MKNIIMVIMLFCTDSLAFAQSISYNHLRMIATDPILSEATDLIKHWNYRLIDSDDKGLIYGWGNFTNLRSNVPWAIICIQIQGYLRFVTWSFSSKEGYKQISESVKRSGEWKKKSGDIENEGLKLTYENNNGSCLFLTENEDGWYKVTYSYFNMDKFIEDYPVPEDYRSDYQNN